MPTNTDTEEAPEDQIFRVLKEMVKSGELVYEQREDGELYFSLKEPILE